MKVALLRGINVGGKNKIAMKDLRALFEAAGATEVRTYIQSGNVVFKGATGVAKQVQSDLQDAGIQTNVIVRSQKDFLGALSADPFEALEDDAPELKLRFIGFADRKIGREADDIDPERSPGDRCHVDGGHVYLDLQRGMSRSKLTPAYVERVLKRSVTFRNLRSCRAIADLF